MVKIVTLKLRIFLHNKKLFNLTMPIVGATCPAKGQAAQRVTSQGESGVSQKKLGLLTAVRGMRGMEGI